MAYLPAQAGSAAAELVITSEEKDL